MKWDDGNIVDFLNPADINKKVVSINRVDRPLIVLQVSSLKNPPSVKKISELLTK